MIDDKIEPKANDRLEQAQPEQIDHYGQQFQAYDAIEWNRHLARGCRPLFRN